LEAGDEVDVMLDRGYIQLADTYFMGWLYQQEVILPTLVATNDTTTTSLN